MTVIKKRVGVLISGGGTNLQALLDATATPDYPAEIALVVSNNPDAYGLKRAETAGVKSIAIDHRDYEDRASFEAAIQDALKSAKVEIVCLAGFMRILTAPFVNAWAGRMLNVHPSLLPDYKGLNTYARALADDVERFGCSVHIVTPNLDDGPVLVQGVTEIIPNETQETLEPRVHALEQRTYPMALKLLTSGRFSIREDKAEVNGENLPIIVSDTC